MSQQLEMFGFETLSAAPVGASLPGSVKLRPYQEEALAAIEGYRIQGYNRQLLHLATGLGKCLGYCEPVFLADGRICYAEQLVGRTVEVIGLDNLQSMNQIPVQASFTENGVREVFKIELDNGVILTRTGEHPFWAANLNENMLVEAKIQPCRYSQSGRRTRAINAGWVKAEDLAVCGTRPNFNGHVILCSTQLNQVGSIAKPDHEVILCAALMADGSLTVKNYTGFSKANPTILKLVNDACRKLGCELVRVEPNKHDYRISCIERGQRNPINRLVKDWGIKHKSIDKTLPAWVYQLPNEQIALFLRVFFDCDGWLMDDVSSSPRIFVTLANPVLIEQLAQLALRLGIIGTFTFKPNKFAGAYSWSTYMVEEWADRVGSFSKADKLKAMVEVKKTCLETTSIRNRDWRQARPTGKELFSDCPAGYEWHKVRKIGKGTMQTVSIEVHTENHAYVGYAVEHNTVSAAECMRRAGQPVLAMMHREELAYQAMAAIKTVWPDASVGLVKAENNQVGRDVTVALVQTISSEKRFREAFPAHRLAMPHFIWTDECFPAGTLIDGKPIEQIKKGDFVTAYDELTGEFVKSKVARLYKRKVSRNLVLTAAAGRMAVSTPNHPFFTKNGWVQARSILNNEVLVYAPDSNELLQMQQDRFAHYKNESRQLQSVWKSILLGRVQAFSIIEGEFAAYVANQPEICLGQDEIQQPYVKTGGQGKIERDTSSNGLETKSEGWEWSGFNGSSVAVVESSGSGKVAHRVYSQDRGAQVQLGTPSKSLQTGPGATSVLDSGGSGRSFSSSARTPGAGREEGRISDWFGLDGFAFLEPGSDGTFGGLCPDGYVYNFEVEYYHTYVANGFVVHNCHHTAATTYRWIYGALGLLEKGGQNFHLGVTATPKRADNKGLDDIFDVIAYSMGIRDGIVQGYLCDLKGHTLVFENDDMDDVKMVGDDYNQGQLDKAVRKVARNEAILEAWLEHAKLPDGTYRPTIGFGVGVQHAYELAATFSKAGIKADVVHGQLEDDKRRAVLNKYAAGKIQILWNVGVLTEGYDHPPTSCIIMARPTKSGGLYTQIVGRGTRLYPGKANCLILDVADVSSRNSLNQPVTLGKALGLVESDGKPKKEIESVVRQLKMKGMGGGIPLDQKDVRGSKEFDPFADPFAASELVGFRWHKVQAGLTLSLPRDTNRQGNPQWLVIHRHPKTWLYDITLVTRIIHGQNGAGYNNYRYVEKFLNDNQFLSEELAAAWAGNWASRNVPGISRLADKNATWRTDANARPTEGQVSMLRKFYKNRPPPGYEAATLTKGQASELIDLAIASKIKVSDRPLSELDLVS